MSWKTDGDSKSTVEGNALTCDPPEGNVANAIWSSGIKDGKAYWKVKMENGSAGCLFAGITDLDKLKPGWAGKGLLYGGNLSDGSGLLVGRFGPSLKAGDTLGILCEVTADVIRVYFDINGTSLGLAFDVPRATLGEEVFPSVHFSEKGTVSISAAENIPNTTREPERFEGMAGTWQYTEGSVQIPAAAADEPPTLELKRKNEHAYSGALRVINNISVGLTRDGSSDPWTGRVGASTMMGGPEEEMALERRMIELLSESGPLNLELEGTDKLTLLGTGGASGIWKRISVVPKAVDWNPFQP